MDLNLDTLKREILDYLGASPFAVFRSLPGALDALPVIAWDAETFPDYRMFLEAAHKAGQKLILFSSQEFLDEELEEALEELEGANLEREEKREFEKTIRGARRHTGSTCVLELAFDYNSHLYLYELRTDWYEEFIETVEELSAFGSDDTDDFSGDEHDGLGGGFYSNN